MIHRNAVWSSSFRDCLKTGLFRQPKDSIPLGSTFLEKNPAVFQRIMRQHRVATRYEKLAEGVLQIHPFGLSLGLATLLEKFSNALQRKQGKT